jgi:RNA polymerase sigma factor for flagellar operon FliA
MSATTNDTAVLLWAAFTRDRKERDRDALARHYLPLVRATVYRLATSAPLSIDREDLIAVGNGALARAIDAFDPCRGVPFETFALTPIRGAILDALRGEDPLSRTARRQLAAVLSATETIESEGGEANALAVASLLGIPADDVTDILAASERRCDISLAPEDEERLIAPDTCDQEAQKEAQKAVLLVAIERLPPRWRTAVALYYFGEQSGREIGAVLGVSDKRARQLLHLGVRRLQTMLSHQESLFV